MLAVCASLRIIMVNVIGVKYFKPPRLIHSSTTTGFLMTRRLCLFLIHLDVKIETPLSNHIMAYVVRITKSETI